MGDPRLDGTFDTARDSSKVKPCTEVVTGALDIPVLLEIPGEELMSVDLKILLPCGSWYNITICLINKIKD